MFPTDMKNHMSVSWPRRCIACGKQMEEGSERTSKTFERIWIDRERLTSSEGEADMIERHERIRATLYICEECNQNAENQVSAVDNTYENREDKMGKATIVSFFITLGFLAFQIMFPILSLPIFGVVASALIIITILFGAIWSRIAKRAVLIQILRDNPPAAFLGIDADEEGNLVFGFSSVRYAEEFKKMNPSLNTKSELDPFSL